MSLRLLYGKKGETVIFSDSIPACNIKTGLCKQLNVLFLYKYQRLRPFTDLCTRCLRFSYLSSLFKCWPD